jgi:uncharacterized C2H2 Zn-finger protein
MRRLSWKRRLKSPFPDAKYTTVVIANETAPPRESVNANPTTARHSSAKVAHRRIGILLQAPICEMSYNGQMKGIKQVRKAAAWLGLSQKNPTR